MTDGDGVYSISVPADGILVFSSVGYKDLEVAVAGKALINVEMAPDTEMIEETIVVAFGTATKEYVERSRARYGYGTQILINHGYGYKTRYAHLNKLHVEKGDTIKRGQLIADMGNTGISTSPHLHYEVIYNRSHVNPINYFDRNMSAEAYKSLMNQIQEATYESE